MEEHDRIKEKRLNILKQGYDKPDFVNYITNHTKTQDTCSDMASGGGGGGGCGPGCDVCYGMTCHLFSCVAF